VSISKAFLISRTEGWTAGGPKGDNWSREHFFFPGNICLHLTDISTHRQYTKKGYKTLSPTWPTGSLVSRSPCMPPFSLSLLFSTNKIFPTSAAGVCLCLHSQSGLKNPEHLKFLHMLSVHHIWWPRRDKSSPEVGTLCTKLEKTA
jgi:hypothetical protein